MASFMSDVDPFDTADNTQGWDICIECRDDAYFPTPAHLRHAEDHISKLDAVWAAQCTPIVNSPHLAATSASSASPMNTDSPSSARSSPPETTGNTPPMSPTLVGLSNLRVNTSSPKPIFRPSPVGSASSTSANGREGSKDINAAIRSRSASPSPGDRDRRPIIQRGSSSSHLRTQSPTPMYHVLQQPRPAPNPRSIVHLSFPSSPPSNPHTTAQLLNMLSFLCRYADPQGWTAGAYSNLSTNGLPGSSSKRRGSLSVAFSSTSSGNGSAAAVNAAYQYTPQPPTALSRPLRILLHSMDGYTETSVLALSYIMHARRCNLPEAYLELQLEKNRSFFVCPGDMGVLRRVESTLGSVDSERRREEKLARREKERQAAAARERDAAIANAHHHQHKMDDNAMVASNATVTVSELTSASASTLGMPSSLPSSSSSRWSKWSGSWRNGTGSLGLGPVFGSFSATPGGGVGSTAMNETPGGSTSAAIPSSISVMNAPPAPKSFPPVQRARALTSPVSLPSHMDHSAWFMDPRFDGSFPSRVLPHVYLGNLCVSITLFHPCRGA